jgi:hypothetical protein
MLQSHGLAQGLASLLCHICHITLQKATAQESRTAHLTPPMPSPTIPTPTAAGSSPPHTPSQAHIPNHFPLLQPQAARPHPLHYVFCKHNEVLTILTNGKLPNGARVPRDPALRSLAMQVVERSGFVWPSILDEDAPSPSDDESGVKYDRFTVE